MIFLISPQEREEVELREEERRKQYEAEMKRLEREAAEREKQRYLEEQEKIKKAHAKERLEQLRQTSLGAKVFAEMDEEVRQTRPSVFLISFFHRFMWEKNDIHQNKTTNEKLEYDSI